jgi:hypothetical protein
MNMEVVLKTDAVSFEVLDAIKEVIPQENIGARFNPSLDGLFGMTMDKDTIQHLSISSKIK